VISGGKARLAAADDDGVDALDSIVHIHCPPCPGTLAAESPLKGR
jgi:hypothetical protein